MNFKFSNIISIRTLLIFTILGLLTGFDFTDSWGCVIYPHFFFLTPLSLFTLLSIGAFYFANKTSNLNLVQRILIGECLLYIFRLIVFKGGYAVGFGGIPDPTILIYDSIALGLRFFILKKIFFSKFNSLLIPGAIIGILFLKSTLFAIPPFYFYQEQRDISKGRKLQTEISGKYNGEIKLVSEEENVVFKTNVEITSDSITIKTKNFEFEGTYFLLLESRNFGFIRKDEFGTSFYLNNFKENQLNFSIENHDMELYQFDLQKEKTKDNNG